MVTKYHSYPWAQFCMTSGSALMSALDSSSTMSRPIIKWLQSLRNSSNLAVLFEIICSCCHFNLSASCTSVFLASTRAEIQFEILGEVIYFSESRILKEFHNSVAVCFSNTIQRVQFNESDYFNFGFPQPTAFESRIPIGSFEEYCNRLLL